MTDFFKYRSGAFALRLTSAVLFINSIVLTGSAIASPRTTADTDTIPDSSRTYHQFLSFNSLGLKKVRLNKTIMADSLSVPSWVSDTMPSKTAITQDKLVISGVMRFITYFRHMDKSYDDMITSDRNISFLDYPLANAGTISTGGYPLLELSLSSKVSPRFNYFVGYSFAHNFTGDPQGDLARNISARQKLFFTGNYNTRDLKVSLAAGTVLWSGVSRFTVSQPEYRDDYFDRLPWDWYRKSFERYETYYAMAANLGSQMAIGTAPFQGFVVNASLLPYDIKLSSMFGRTNRNLALSDATTFFPSYTYAGKAEKTIFTGPVHGIFAANFYTKQADTDRSHGKPDDIGVISGDFKLRIKKVGYYGEIAYGRVNNPSAKNQSGLGFNFKVEWDKNVSPLPFSAEVYSIDKNVVSLDGAILNSGNSTVLDGGAATQYIYSQLLLLNVMQETQQLANNRRGMILKGEKQFGKLKVQLITAMSQEIENSHDTITIQHRVNAFSRSRFHPWFQAGGPYARIKSGWRRTYETITINDDPAANYKKGFNGVDLLLKYKLSVGRHDLVLINFTNVNTVQPGFSPIPVFTSKAFMRTFYDEFTAALKLSPKYTVSGTAGIERMMGNNQTNLSPENGKAIDMTGTRLGLGVDYDFSPEASIHLRNTWMTNKDKNFMLDQFKGTETTLELKIFF